MTKYIIHGDDQVKSRDELSKILEKYKKENRAIVELDGTTIRPHELESTLQTSDLFDQLVIVLENVLNRPLSKDKKSIIALLQSYMGDKDLVLWEKKALTPTQLKALGGDAIVRGSKSSASIFPFLDQLTPDNFRSSLSRIPSLRQELEDGFIYIMLTRRIADLLIVKSGDASTLNPYVRSRLISQAEKWTSEELVRMLNSLRNLDYAIKSGKTTMAYSQHLDLLLASNLR